MACFWPIYLRIIIIIFTWFCDAIDILLLLIYTPLMINTNQEGIMKRAKQQPSIQSISLGYACYLLGRGLACIDGRGEENTYLRGLDFDQRYVTKEFRNDGLNQSV